MSKQSDNVGMEANVYRYTVSKQSDNIGVEANATGTLNEQSCGTGEDATVHRHTMSERSEGTEKERESDASACMRRHQASASAPVDGNRPYPPRCVSPAVDLTSM